VGRGPEIAAVLERLRVGRVVTLTGPGGCGKTRLALRAATLAAGWFGDGARLVELASLTDPALVPASVAEALGVPERDAADPVAAVVRALAGRELLIVLDNCEHVLGPAARVVVMLAGRCRRVRILSTSRERLDVPGEVVFPVPPLGLPEDGSVRAVAASEAGALFAARAAAVSPGFALTAANSAAVAEVCSRLDGMPLAIELAAARCPALGPAELAARLEGYPGLLAGGAARPGRHRSLEALVSWSYELLGGAERRLLNRLSVLRGGFDLEVAERVAGGGPLAPEAVAGLLASLAGKSLVQVQAGVTVRYSLLETVRQFAAARLAASGEETAVHARLLGWALEVARSADAASPGAGRAGWADRLSAGQASLRAALSWALGGAEPQTGRELAARLARWWIATGRYSEAGQFLTAAAGVPAAAAPGIQARVLLGAAWSAFHLGDFGRANPLAGDGIARARQAGEPQLEAWGRNLLAVLAWHAGDADRIVAEIEASRGLSGQADPALAAGAQVLLANAAFLSGDLAGQDLHGRRYRARPDGSGPGRARPRADRLVAVRDLRSEHPARDHGRARRGREPGRGASGPLHRDDHAQLAGAAVRHPGPARRGPNRDRLVLGRRTKRRGPPGGIPRPAGRGAPGRRPGRRRGRRRRAPPVSRRRAPRRDRLHGSYRPGCPGVRGRLRR
jgi:predicted ATPase